MKRWMLGFLCAAVSASGVEPVSVHHGRIADFIGGQGEGVALHGDGHLSLAPELRPLVDLETERIWAMTSSAGRIYIASGDDGTIHIVDDGKIIEHFKAGEGAPLAVEVGASGVYVGTGPPGQLLRRRGAASTELLVSTSSQYIWDLAVDADGVLIACGSDARVLRWARSGEVDTLFHSATDGHVRTMVRRDGKWLVGTSASEGTKETTGRGRVYELDSVGGSRLVLETEYEEIASLVDVEGDLFVAAMTVPASGDPAVGLLKVSADGASYPVWRGSGIWAGLVRDGGDLIAVTREPTRVLRLAADGQTGAILARTDSLSPSAIAIVGRQLILGDSQSGRIWHMTSDNGSQKGHFESSVHDAESVSIWGAMTWHSTGRVEIQTRSGNSTKPDDSWSDWSRPLKAPGSTIRSPSARYLQYRVKLTHGEEAPRLDRISFTFRQANLPPRIDEVIAFPYRGGPGALQNPEQIPLPGHQRANGHNGPMQRKSLLVLRWKANDPNDDPLTYRIYLRGEGHKSWKLIEADVDQIKTVVWDTERMPEGVTQLRLVASDASTNPGATALEDAYVTTPFTIDNSPPTVQLRSVKHAGKIVIEADLSDAVSALRGARFGVDYDDKTTRLAAGDGLFDSNRETLRFELPTLTAGEHVISVQAWDELENLGVGQVVVEIEP